MEQQSSSQSEIFIWLCIHNKILTWENLRRHGFCGPGVCSLCMMEDEHIDHLFGRCVFFQSVWIHLGSRWNLLPAWEGDTIWYNLTVCCDHSATCSVVPFYTLWEVWCMRNGLVFHGIKPCADVTAARIFAWHSLTSSVPGCDFFRAAPFMADQHMYLYGFLDGAAQNGDCAAGIVVKLAQAHVIFIHLKAGSGSNTRAELVALYGFPL